MFRRQFELILENFFLINIELKKVNQRFEHIQVTYTVYTLVFSQFKR